MGAFVVREVQDGRQGEPAIHNSRTKALQQNPRVTLQAIVVLSLFIPLPSFRSERWSLQLIGQNE